MQDPANWKFRLINATGVFIIEIIIEMTALTIRLYGLAGKHSKYGVKYALPL